YGEIADIASRHNAIGVTKAESMKLGRIKGVNLLPNSIESKIISFADSFRPHFVSKSDYWSMRQGSFLDILKRHDLVKIAELRKKRIGKFLIKNGMDYEKLYEEFIEKK
ncbi:MAG: hypothetical protein PHN56_05430, partial [Candidatus Nanoarchaeia archaeon]|nr:hypothetical protein [Candidatus Nanoarchaeia archaeon]